MTDAAPQREGLFQPGLILGHKFALIRRLASGGIGSVYEAQDLLVRRRVALKLINSELSQIPEVTRRFLREARATAAVNHPNVVTILEMGRLQNGSYFIAQELVRGPCLREHLAACHRLEVDDALVIMLPVMSALSAAHRRGIVHRDVKPDNILLATGSEGELVPKLVDFGAAKMVRRRKGRPTQTGAPVGTPHYMAPEQVRGDHDVDSRVDVWAVGVVLSELMSGRLLFNGGPGGSPAVTYGQILHEAEARIAEMLSLLPPALAAALRGALRPERDDRYPTMSAFQRELAVAGGAAVRSLFPAPLPSAAIAARSGVGWVGQDASDEEWEDEETEPPSLRFSSQSTPPDNPELAFSTGGDEAEPTLEDRARAAEQALGRNALDLAISAAEQVLADEDESLHPRMWLVYGVAHLWLGHYAECERGGQRAMDAFEPHTTGWYVALGHVATACGPLGKGDALATLHAALSTEAAEPDPARDVAACRLAVVMVRAGMREQADELLEQIKASPAAAEHSLVSAWREVVAAELAMHTGDVSRYLAHTEAATEYFTFAGDVRNACLQRHNVGNALMQLGAYERAELVFREVLDVSEPMRLNLVAGALANLGFTLSRIGALDTAWEVETRALRLCSEQGNRRFEAVASIYLALILAMQRDLDAAVQIARDGVNLAAHSPSTLAQARAVLATMLLLRDEPDNALTEARAAMKLLERLGGVEEGEALIRLVLMTALARLGRDDLARDTAAQARERLELRARRIANPAWRRSFLNDVPEHARTLELAATWLDDEQDNAPISVARVHQTLMGLGGVGAAPTPMPAGVSSDTHPGLGETDDDQT